jgi:hypothetical protein
MIHVTPMRLVGCAWFKASNSEAQRERTQSLCNVDDVNNIVGVLENVHDLCVVKTLGITQTTGTVNDHRGHLETEARDVMDGLFGLSSHPEASLARRKWAFVTLVGNALRHVSSKGHLIDRPGHHLHGLVGYGTADRRLCFACLTSLSAYFRQTCLGPSGGASGGACLYRLGRRQTLTVSWPRP